MKNTEEYTSPKEEQLLLEAIHASSDEKKWKAFFDYINAVFSGFRLKDTMPVDNEKNIRNAVQLIFNQKWHEKWEPNLIFSKEFYTLCGIPICLPCTFPGLLSGEYILYLLHPDSINFYHTEKIPVNKVKDEEDEEDKEDKPHSIVVKEQNEKTQTIKQKIYRKKYNRFYANDNSYMIQFQDNLGVEFQFLKESSSQKHYQRKNSKLWGIFELYRYLEKDYPNSEEVNNAKIFTSLNKTHLDLFFNGTINALSDTDKKILLFLTVIFQKMEQNDRSAIYRHIFGIHMRYLFAMGIADEIRQWMYTLCVMAYYPMNIKSQDDARSLYEKAHKQWIDRLNEITNWLQKYYDGTLEKQTFLERVPVTEENLYLTIMWRILSIFRKREVESYRLATNLCIDARETYEANCIPFKNRLSFSKTINVKNEKELLKKYSDIIALEFPDISEIKELKKIINLAIKVIVYCNHNRFQFDYLNKDYPKSPAWRWYASIGIHIQDIKFNELLACMKLIRISEKIPAKMEGKGTKRFLRFYPIIIPDLPKKDSLYHIMDNIKTHACEPLFKSLIIWYSTQNDGNLVMAKCIKLQQKVNNLCFLGMETASYVAKSMYDEQKIWYEVVSDLNSCNNKFQDVFIPHFPPFANRQDFTHK